jgi:hypothetical protein
MSCGGERQLSAYSVEKLAPTGMSDFSRFDFEKGERLRMPGGRRQEPLTCPRIFGPEVA